MTGWVSIGRPTSPPRTLTTGAGTQGPKRTALWGEDAGRAFPTPSVFVPAAHRWMPVSCMPSTTQQVNYAFLPTGPAYGTVFTSAATTHTVHALPSMTLSVEPVPTQSVLTGPTPTQPAPTMTQHAFTMPRPAMPVHTMNEHAPTTLRPTVPGLAECTLTVTYWTYYAYYV